VVYKLKIMYTNNRLEWHLGDELSLEPRRVLCGLDRQQASLLTQFNRLAVVLAKNQDHRASCGVFVFGQRNAVRRWLRLRYPDTRADQIGERGLSPRARWLKQSGTVRGDDMAPKSRTSRHRRTLILITVRLCFAPTFTKEQ